MILGFRHRGLRRLFEKGDGRRISPRQVAKVQRILARLDEAQVPGDMDLPGFELHPLKGTLARQWAVSVSGNRRIVFRLDGSNVRDVNLTDYH